MQTPATQSSRCNLRDTSRCEVGGFWGPCLKLKKLESKSLFPQPAPWPCSRIARHVPILAASALTPSMTPGDSGDSHPEHCS